MARREESTWGDVALLAAAGLMAGFVAFGVPAGARGASPAANGKIAFYRDSEGVITIDPDGTHERLIARISSSAPIPGHQMAASCWSSSS